MGEAKAEAGTSVPEAVDTVAPEAAAAVGTEPPPPA